MDDTDVWMSTIGFAARPGTEVEPTWSTRTASDPSAARIRVASASKRAGQEVSASVDLVLPTSSALIAGLRPRSPEPRQQCQRIEQGLLRGVLGRGVLRMPLDADHPDRVDVVGIVHVQLDRLDQPVGAVSGRNDAVTQVVNALMMVRRARERARLRRGREPSPGRGRHVMGGDGVGDRHAVLEHARHVREMLMERAAERDVHDLHPSTDRERGQAQTIRGDAGGRSPAHRDRVRRRKGASRRVRLRSERDPRRRRPPTSGRRTARGSRLGRSFHRDSRSRRERRLGEGHRGTGRVRRIRLRANGSRGRVPGGSRRPR